MTDSAKLGHRAVLCPGWRWLPGMLTAAGLRVVDVDGAGKVWLDDDYGRSRDPDQCGDPALDDCGTLGGLWQLVAAIQPGATWILHADGTAVFGGRTARFEGSWAGVLVCALESASGGARGDL